MRKSERTSEQIKEQAREIDDKTLHIMYVVIKNLPVCHLYHVSHIMIT